MLKTVPHDWCAKQKHSPSIYSSLYFSEKSVIFQWNFNVLHISSGVSFIVDYKFLYSLLMLLIYALKNDIHWIELSLIVFAATISQKTNEQDSK
jgi:hypothetical protein